MKKNSNLILFSITIILVIGMMAVMFIQLNKNSDEGTNLAANGADNQARRAAQTQEKTTIREGESLMIPVSEVSGDASFYPIEVDGVEMEVLALKDAEGTIRTAFNTCQVCYTSGNGYYIQDGEDLVCQNCGNHFTKDEVEIESGGCNPWPIFAENKTVTDDHIEIAYDYLASQKEVFANWK